MPEEPQDEPPYIQAAHRLLADSYLDAHNHSKFAAASKQLRSVYDCAGEAGVRGWWCPVEQEWQPTCGLYRQFPGRVRVNARLRSVNDPRSVRTQSLTLHSLTLLSLTPLSISFSQVLV